MANVFLQSFLMISDVKTILFLIVLVALFGVIHVLYRKKHMDFAAVVMIGTGLGLVLGVAMQIVAGFPNNPMEITFISETTTWYSLFGNGFIDLIKMLVVPLVMASIAEVIINMQEGHNMGRMVKVSIIVTMVMVAIASIVGLSLGLIFNLGAGSAPVGGEAEMKEISSIVSTLRGLIPSNIVDGAVKSNIIGLVIFSAIFGYAAWWVKKEFPEYGNALCNVINGVHKTMINMANLILDFMPFAVIALLANTIAQRGMSSILEVGKFILVLYLAVIIQFCIQLVGLSIHGINPVYYLRKSIDTMILAFTSRSSVGCLPKTIETLTEKLGVNEGTASFVAGFGTTAGMQGCAGVFPSLLIVYVAHVTNTPIDITLIVMTIIVVTIGSLGIAGIPGTATMAASVGLSGVGMGAQFSMISPILAVDPLIDMGRTFLNVTGSLTNALMVDKRLGNFDAKAYGNMELNKLKTKR